MVDAEVAELNALYPRDRLPLSLGEALGLAN
jgi:hypothetical protein